MNKELITNRIINPLITPSIRCSINLSDILKINEDGSAVITMPKAPDGYYIDHREILEQLSKAGILKGNETYKF